MRYAPGTRVRANKEHGTVVRAVEAGYDGWLYTVSFDFGVTAQMSDERLSPAPPRLRLVTDDWGIDVRPVEPPCVVEV